MHKSLRRIKLLYIGACVILTLTITLTPILIRDGFSLLTEEMVEIIVIGSLILIGFVINNIYRQEIERKQFYLNNALKHIGEKNVLADRLQKTIIDWQRCPKSKKEFRDMICVAANHVLGIVNAPYVYFRIIDSKNLRTITECLQYREQKREPSIQVSNKRLVRRESINDASYYSSTISNVSIRTFCVFPLT